MMRRLQLPTSNEEKVAKKIGTILSDFSLDLEQVGKYIAVALPYTVYARAVEVLEAANYNKDVAEYNEMHKLYPEKLF
jgi:flagellin-specific chaperone FliS